jgi:myo-inositol 2-dehydrogenase/D-chiro-inositol 1-dehydrogenase
MVVKDTLVHEVDVTRFLFGEEITSVRIIKPTPNTRAPQGLQDPQIAIFCTQSGRHIDVELFVTTGVAYEVRTEVVGELGSATIGFGRTSPGFREHFGPAYDIEVQRWVDAVRAGANVAGPTAWDGYAAAAVCEAGVRSLETGQEVGVELAERAGA